MCAFEIKKQIGNFVFPFWKSGKDSDAFDVKCDGKDVCLYFHKQSGGVYIRATLYSEIPEKAYLFFYKAPQYEKYDMDYLKVL